jgi:hypothetical protein
LQGQDSVLLLLLCTLGFDALKRETNFLAGCWFAVGAFKFQWILPIIVLIVVWKVKRVAAGFAMVSLILAFVSIGLVGWQNMLHYPAYVLRVVNTPSFGGVGSEIMPNLRGLAVSFSEGGGKYYGSIKCGYIVSSRCYEGERGVSSAKAGAAIFFSGPSIRIDRLAHECARSRSVDSAASAGYGLLRADTGARTSLQVCPSTSRFSYSHQPVVDRALVCERPPKSDGHHASMVDLENRHGVGARLAFAQWGSALNF